MSNRQAMQHEITAEYNRRRLHGMAPAKPLRAVPTPSGGITIEANGRALMTIEPAGTVETPPIGSYSEGQHWIATPLEGPDRGQQTRLV